MVVVGLDVQAIAPIMLSSFRVQALLQWWQMQTALAYKGRGTSRICLVSIKRGESNMTSPKELNISSNS